MLDWYQEAARKQAMCSELAMKKRDEGYLAGAVLYQIRAAEAYQCMVKYRESMEHTQKIGS